MGKRGQVTLFIVVGLVIISIIGLLVYYKSGELGLREVSVPAQVQPIYDHVENCLDEVSIDGLNLIGSQGGFYKVDKGLDYFDNQLTAYYWLDEYSVKYPELGKIESELEDYVDDNLKNCVDFSNFNGFEVIDGRVSSHVVLGENVIVNLNYPLEIKKEGAVFKINKFVDEINLDFKRIYEASKGILYAEAGYGEIPANFLEYATNDFIGYYSGYAKGDLLHPLPPRTGSDFNIGKCNPKTWNKRQVREDLKEILYLNMLCVDVNSLDNVECDGIDEISDGIYKGLKFDILDEKEIDVRFVYLKEFPLELDVVPNEGDLIKPDTYELNSLFLKTCNINYDFWYDIKYSVLVDLTDKSALSGKGYSFKFPMKVVIVGNTPREVEFQEVSASEDESFFCDNKQKVADFNLKVVDEKNNLIDDAFVYYSCIDERCFINKSYNGLIKDKLPTCVGGILEISKDGYLSSKLKIDSREDVKVNKIATLESIKDKKISFKGLSVSNGVSLKNYNDKYKIYLFLERKKNALYEESYGTSLVYPENDKIGLVSGDYNVDILVIYDDYLKIEDLEFDKNVIVGGASFVWSVSKEDLLSNKDLEFYYFDFGLPKTADDITNMFNNIDKYSEDYLNRVRPRFV